LRPFARALLLLAAAAGCSPCGIGSNPVDIYVGAEVKQGDVAAPPAWGVATTIDQRAGVSCPGGVAFAWQCADNGTCETACFSVSTLSGPPPGYATIMFGFTVSELPWAGDVVLPDNRVNAYGILFTDDPAVPEVTLALVSGTVHVAFWRNNFDAHFALDTVSTDGQHVTLANGRFALLGGHHETECRKGD
jgi:hypothetical protein